MPSKHEEQLSILDQGEFQFYTVTAHGMTFTGDIPRDEWLDVMKRLCGMVEGAEMTKQRALMLVADAANYGEKRFGEEYAEAIQGMRQALGLTPKTIANAQWVYSRIESSRRRDGLTLGHYSVIAALKDAHDQDGFIDMVITDPKHTLTVAELKEEVATAFPKTKRGKARKKKVAVLEIRDANHAKDMLNDLCLWIGLNEKSLDSSFKPFLERMYRTYRRKWMGGHRK